VNGKSLICCEKDIKMEKNQFEEYWEKVVNKFGRTHCG
jgi:hypothetical protein